jgi:hypothetical protein
VSFERVIRVQLEKFKPEAVRQAHIAFARKGLAEFFRGQREKPGFTIEVDGRPATSEQSVKPFGVITYRFVRLQQIGTAALAEARRVSPYRSGRYRRSWFAMANGAEIDLMAIPPGVREILITNDQPYSRKINVGAKGFKTHAGLVEKVKELMKRRFGNLAEFRVIYITLGGGHVLKNDQMRRGRPRRDARAGSDLTYPALKITMR